MTKNIKFIAPLALVAFGTLASCGGGKASGAFAHLKRVEYDTVEADKFVPKYKDILKSQVTGTEIELFNLFEKGTLNLNYALSLNASIRGFMQEEMPTPIDLNGINFAEQNSVTFSWSAKDEYMKATSKSGTTYIVHDKAESKWYKCFDIGEDQKFKVELKNYIGFDLSTAYYPSFENAVVGEAAANCGLFIPRNNNDITVKPNGISFGLTGAGMVYTDRKQPVIFVELPQLLVQLERKLGEGGLAKVLAVIDGLDVGVAKVGAKEAGTLSLNAALTGLDLSKIQDLFKDYIKLPKGLTLGGSASADYFVAFEKNFIKQHEFIMDLDNVTVLYETDPEKTGEYDYVSAELSASAYLGEEVKEGECTPDKVDVKDYTTVTFGPTPVTPSYIVVE